jgi:uncharacterized protein (DUF1015 family)
VVSDQQRVKLYENPLNSIHLSVPQTPDPAARAQKTLQNWKDEGILVQDLLPAIYVYYQYFYLPGNPKKYCRKGFICNIKAYDWDENVVLRHENTMPAAVKERVDLLKSTELNASATHGLYSDPEFKLEKLMDESMTHPILEAEDYQGVKEQLSVIHDREIILQFISLIKHQQIILADGHHRYQGSIDYRKLKTSENPHLQGTEGYNYHMMFLTNMEAQDLRILATHRLISGLPDFDAKEVVSSLSQYFELTAVETPSEINEIILGKPHTFGVIMLKQAFRATLKKGLTQQIDWPFPDLIKDLDLTVLHHYIIERVLGIPGKEHTLSPNIKFNRNFTDCLEQVKTGKAQVALITNEVSMDTVKKVCFSGYTLPQKSTYFYPKVVCGFVFGTIKEDEFQHPHYPSF